MAAFRLARFGHDVLPHLDAFKNGMEAPRPRRRASFVAIYRRDYTVYREELDRAQFEVLEALCAGRPLGGALASAPALRRVAASARDAKLFRWFRTWMAAGYFAAVRLDAR